MHRLTCGLGLVISLVATEGGCGSSGADPVADASAQPREDAALVVPDSGFADTAVGGDAGESPGADGRADAADRAEDAGLDADDPKTPPELSLGCASGPRSPATNERRTLVSGEQERQYVLDVPSSYDGDPMPVVFNFHGLGGSGTLQRRSSAMADKAQQGGFIVVHPDGIGRTWEIGTAPNGDTRFVRDLLDSIEKELCVDTRRVYATGMSMGGFFSHLLGCALEDRIAAIAPVAAGSAVSRGVCQGKRPMPVFQLHSVKDELVRVGMGRAARDRWIEHNGCKGEPRVTEASCQQWVECSEDSEVVWCEVDDTTHIGTWSSEFPVNDAIWSFFGKHSRP